jgi:nucleotide-binding universal stress UspA family protein
VAEDVSLLGHLLVPVADDGDAGATADALNPHLDVVGRVTLVHVLQKGGGVADKAPVAKRRADAKAFLSVVESRLGDEAVTIGRRVEFGTNVADTIVETATDVDATAIAFHPRGGNRLVRWLSGDTAVRLVSAPEFPVLSLATPAPGPAAIDACAETDREEVG